MSKQKLSSEEIVELAIAALEDVKGTDILKMDVRDKTSIADYMLICTGSSNRQLNALVEIPLNTRGKNADVARLTRQEGEAMLGKVQPGERIVTLEVHGKPWSTEQLASELDRWRLDARTVNLMVGGPEGLAPEVCARSEQRWSLSPLTLPHPLVRILLGEQIYRAWTVLSGHPYHK